ncbi:glutathione S-transferase [Variovorax sp. GrIS 2.14]
MKETAADARILLAEKGLAHETVQVDLRTNEQLGEAYRLINPLCTVPALRSEEGLLLTDNAAIAAYIDARYPEPSFLGVTAAERAEVASWNSRIEFDGLMAIADALRNSAPSLVNRALPGPVDHAQIPELAQRGLARVQQFRLCARGESQADRAAFPPVALACRNGRAALDVALGRRPYKRLPKDS